MSKKDPSLQEKPAGFQPWRAIGLLALFTVLGLAFWGYLTPDMRVQWANFAALCGF